MKKLTLSLMAIVIGVLAVSVISAAIAGVAFVTPVNGANISGSNYLINWTNDGGLPLLSLQSREGGCNSANSWQDLAVGMGGSTKTHTWDVSSLTGIYCLRIVDNVNNDVQSGNITIDNVNPIASLAAGEPYLCNEGDIIVLDASNSLDADTGVASYAWDLDDDGNYDDGTGATINYTCSDGPSLKDVAVEVADYAGNTDEASSTVNISNVAPVCNGITGFTDFAVTEPMTLDENATDVVDSLVYTWDFDNGDNELGNPANYTYNTAGTYNVTVTVSDGTESCMDSLLIEVVDPTVLASQEVMALQNLDANFTPDEGAVVNSFATGLTGGVACTKRITEPAAMTVVGNGDDCVVTWNAVQNADNGVNPMVVRVSNGTDYEYYSFDTTVWSWSMNLVPGWNLISIPTVPEDTSIQTVLFDQLYNALPGGYEYVVWSYQNGAWLKSRRTGYGDLATVEPGKAYWINMSNADTLYGYGDKLIAASSPPEVTISAGWNLIGHYGLLSVSVGNALQSITGFYGTVLDETGFPIAGNFNPGQGYWVSTQNLLEGQEVTYTPSNESYNFN